MFRMRVEKAICVVWCDAWPYYRETAATKTCVCTTIRYRNTHTQSHGGDVIVQYFPLPPTVIVEQHEEGPFSELRCLCHDTRVPDAHMLSMKLDA